jgi:gamma-glutamylcyclotransferase (GGCT)/AIG2-like uncharacterized protein YtfP
MSGSSSGYVFSYGTLQQEQVQLQLFGRTLNGLYDVLHGYRIISIEITDEKFIATGAEKMQRTLIETNASDSIEGMALELTEEELKKADRYEPSNYFRKSVILESGKKAWIYVAQ